MTYSSFFTGPSPYIVKNAWIKLESNRCHSERIKIIAILWKNRMFKLNEQGKVNMTVCKNIFRMFFFQE